METWGYTSFERSRLYLRKINWVTMCRMDWRRNRLEVNRPVGMLLQSITLARGTGKNEFKFEKLPEAFLPVNAMA